MQQLTQPLNHQITIISYAFILALIIIICRLGYLQLYQGHYFKTRSEKNFLRIEKTVSARGNILDCWGELLATNRPVTNLLWNGSGNYRLTPAQEECLAFLERITTTSFLDDLDERNAITHAERRYKQKLLAHDISFEQLSQLEEAFPSHPNIVLETHFERLYPHNTCASHIVGYLGRQIDHDVYGKMGLEKIFQDTLQGQEGTLLKTINSFGRDIAQTEIQKARVGSPIQTTIDLGLQKLCESIFPDDQMGTIIIMDPKTGAIRALLSKPTFDPNLFLRPMLPEEWEKLQINRPFINRAVTAMYPPGSIFKLISISAALEHGFTTTDHTVYCNGFSSFCGRNYSCHLHSGHGRLNVGQAVSESCNILFFELAKKMDINLFADYARRFGLGEETGIIFHENKGLVPDRAWKKATYKQRWWPGETLSISIGQSYLLVTPIQVVRMVSSIFTGYLVRPRIIETEPIEMEPLRIRQETLNFLQTSMKSVVTGGTGRHVSRVKGIEIYAKTSTAQTSSLEKRDLGAEYLEHAWFVLYFRYQKEEPLAMVILLEKAGSSRVATHLATKFLMAYKQFVDERNTQTVISAA